MSRKKPFGWVLLFTLVYIGFGDQFLPKPLGQYSFQIRSTIDNQLVAVFPNWQPQSQTKGQTQEVIKYLEKPQKSN
jgi:hypothetical protein